MAFQLAYGCHMISHHHSPVCRWYCSHDSQPHGHHHGSHRQHIPGLVHYDHTHLCQVDGWLRRPKAGMWGQSIKISVGLSTFFSTHIYRWTSMWYLRCSTVFSMFVQVTFTAVHCILTQCLTQWLLNPFTAQLTESYRYGVCVLMQFNPLTLLVK